MHYILHKMFTRFKVYYFLNIIGMKKENVLTS